MRLLGIIGCCVAAIAATALTTVLRAIRRESAERPM